MLKFIVTFLYFLVHCRCQVVENDGNCPTTVNNYNCGSEGFNLPPNTNPRDNIQQGRPGKSGIQGIKGQKGMKGDPGTPEDLSAALQEMQTEISELRSKLDKLTPQTTCDHINGTESESGYYLISPNPLIPPFPVYCNFTEESRLTQINHDASNEIEIADCEPARCYKRKINYNASMKQIVALIEASTECRQFIKLRCRGMVLLHNNYAAWISRDGNPQIYWGGATSRRDSYCACGETSSCVDNNYKCNCDYNSSPETSDEGYLTDKNALPVTGLHFGDSGDASEHGWHTLGPLICSGRNY